MIKIDVLILDIYAGIIGSKDHSHPAPAGGLFGGVYWYLLGV